MQRRVRSSLSGIVFAASVLLLSGCPRGLAVPDAAGSACVEDLDCNPGMTCGALRPCVLGHCAADASLPVPCDGGDVIDAGVFDARTADGS
jgi:hypothetical protein